MRLKNLAGLIIGQHLLFDGHDYQVKLTAAETQTGGPYRSRPARADHRH